MDKPIPRFLTSEHDEFARVEIVPGTLYFSGPRWLVCTVEQIIAEKRAAAAATEAAKQCDQTTKNDPHTETSTTSS